MAGYAVGHLGRYGKSLELLAKARDALTRARGPDHTDTLDALDHLATAYRDAGRVPEAIPLLEEELRFRKAKADRDDLSAVGAMNNLALSYREAGRLDKALPLFEEVHRLMKAKSGPDLPRPRMPSICWP